MTSSLFIIWGRGCTNASGYNLYVGEHAYICACTESPEDYLECCSSEFIICLVVVVVVVGVVVVGEAGSFWAGAHQEDYNG